MSDQTTELENQTGELDAPAKQRPKIKPTERAKIIAAVLQLDSYLYGLYATPARARRIIKDMIGVDTAGVNIAHLIHRLCIRPHKNRRRKVTRSNYTADEWQKINEWIERYKKHNLDLLRDTPASLARLSTEWNGPQVSRHAMKEALKLHGIDLPDKPRIIDDVALRYGERLPPNLQSSR